MKQSQKKINKILSLSYIIASVSIVFLASCIRFTPDCENKDPEIIVLDDSLKWESYTVKECMTEGLRYAIIKESNTEIIEYYNNGIKNGISLNIDSESGDVVINRFEDNQLINSEIYLRKPDSVDLADRNQ